MIFQIKEFPAEKCNNPNLPSAKCRLLVFRVPSRKLILITALGFSMLTSSVGLYVFSCITDSINNADEVKIPSIVKFDIVLSKVNLYLYNMEFTWIHFRILKTYSHTTNLRTPFLSCGYTLMQFILLSYENFTEKSIVSHRNGFEILSLYI